MMARKDPVAAAAQKYKPMQSAVPGTPLGPIQIEAFQGGGMLFDTPGVHLHHRQAAVVLAEDLPVLAPQNRLRGKSFPAISDKDTLSTKDITNLNGYSLFWGGLVRLDVLMVPPGTQLTFYGPRKVQVHMVPTVEADEFYQKEVGNLLTPPTVRQRESWSGLEAVRKLQIKFEDQTRPACDIAISGLGWIAVEPFQLKAIDPDDSKLDKIGELNLAVHVPKPVEVFIRPPIPVGKAGEKWYQYRDLTEKEEELRPKWYL